MLMSENRFWGGLIINFRFYKSIELIEKKEVVNGDENVKNVLYF